MIGLTSPGNVDFVQSLGWYTDVVTYDDVASLPEVDAVSVDISGDGPTLAAVHERLGDHLKYSMIIGKSHHDSPFAEVDGGPAPELFFAPTEVSRRIEEWGADEYQRRCAEALDGVRRRITPMAHRRALQRASSRSVDLVGHVRRSRPAEHRPDRLAARLTSQKASHLAANFPTAHPTASPTTTPGRPPASMRLSVD